MICLDKSFLRYHPIVNIDELVQLNAFHGLSPRCYLISSVFNCGSMLDEGLRSQARGACLESHPLLSIQTKLLSACVGPFRRRQSFQLKIQRGFHSVRPLTIRRHRLHIAQGPWADQHDVVPIPAAHESDVVVGIVRPMPEKLPKIRMSTHFPFLTNVILFKRKALGNPTSDLLLSHFISKPD